MSGGAELKVKRSSNSTSNIRPRRRHRLCRGGMGPATGGRSGLDSTWAWSCREDRRAWPLRTRPGSGEPRAPGASGALTGRPRRVIVVGASGEGDGGRDQVRRGGGRGCLWGSASSPSGQPPAPVRSGGRGWVFGVGGIGKPPLPLLPLPPLLQSRAAVQALSSGPGTWRLAAPPSRGSCAPPRTRLSPVTRLSGGARGARLWTRDPGAIEWGCRGEAPVKFSEPQAGVEVRLVGSGGVCLGGTVLFLWFRATARPPRRCVFGSNGRWWEAATRYLIPSLHFGLVWTVRGVLGGLCTHHDDGDHSWWRWMVRVYIPPGAFCLQDILLAILIWTKLSPHPTSTSN